MDFPVNLPGPFLNRAKRLGILPEDIAEDFVKGFGSGGQKVNKTNSCVVLVHRPTNLVVRCQFQREQIANRREAYKLLILKIEDKLLGKQSTRAKKIEKLRKQKKRRHRRAVEKVHPPDNTPANLDAAHGRA